VALGVAARVSAVEEREQLDGAAVQAVLDAVAASADRRCWVDVG
jgi:hypothetical protein